MASLLRTFGSGNFFRNNSNTLLAGGAGVLAGSTLFGSGSGGIMSSIGDTVKLIPYVIVGGGLISVLSLVKR